MILAGAKGDQVPAFESRLTDVVNDVVRHQLEVGLDSVNDGRARKDHLLHVYHRPLTGFDGELPAVALADVLDFPDFYKRVWWASEEAAAERSDAGVQRADQGEEPRGAASRHPESQGRRRSHRGPRMFMTAVSPGLIAAAHGNQYYSSREEFLAAIGEAMREEYEAITAAPGSYFSYIADLPWQRTCTFARRTSSRFKRLSIQSVEALNHATRNIDPDHMRLHLCLGDFKAPTTRHRASRVLPDIVLRARPNGIP